MATTSVHLVTIIAEGILRERLIKAVMDLGAKGYTIGEVHGHGSAGISAQFWSGAQVRLEILTSATIADKILAHLQANYFDTYSVIAYVSEVRVVRGEKYL